MPRLLTSLGLPITIVTKLHKKGFPFVEDVLKNPECLKEFDLNVSEITEKLNVQEELALDVWQIENQSEIIPMFSSKLEAIFDRIGHCGSITELSGPPFSGKTQICLQLCVSVQLNERYGGLNGRAIYIDTRSGVFSRRVKEITRGCNNHFKDLNMNEKEVLENIELFNPISLEQFLQIVKNLKNEIKEAKNQKEVRLIIIDSLSMPILCCVEDPLERPRYYSEILSELEKLILDRKIAVVITNENIMKVDRAGETCFKSAGGQYVAEYACPRLELTRLKGEKFVVQVIKSPIMPELSIEFMITEDGIRDVA